MGLLLSVFARRRHWSSPPARRPPVGDLLHLPRYYRALPPAEDTECDARVSEPGRPPPTPHAGSRPPRRVTPPVLPAVKPSITLWRWLPSIGEPRAAAGPWGWPSSCRLARIWKQTWVRATQQHKETMATRCLRCQSPNLCVTTARLQRDSPENLEKLSPTAHSGPWPATRHIRGHVGAEREHAGRAPRAPSFSPGPGFPGMGGQRARLLSGGRRDRCTPLHLHPEIRPPDASEEQNHLESVLRTLSSDRNPSLELTVQAGEM